MQDNLTKLRERINQLDEQLVELISERAQVAVEIGKTKTSVGSEVYDPLRERTVIEKIDALNQGPLDKGAMEEVFTAIITVCREIQLRTV